MIKKWISLIILFICLSLAGIIVVQYLWIRNAMSIREAQFNQSVNDALGNAVTRLETNENMTLLSSRLISDSIRDLIQNLASDSLYLAQSQIDSNLIKEALNNYPYRWSNKRMIRPDPNIQIYAAEKSLKEYEQFLVNQKAHQRQEIVVDSLVNLLESKVVVENQWVNIQFEWETHELEKLDSVWIVQEQYLQQFYADGKRLDQAYKEAENTHYMNPERSIAQIKDRNRGTTGGFIITHRSPDPVIVEPPPEVPTNKASKILETKIRKLDKRASILQDLIQRMAVEFEELPKTVETRIDKDLLATTLKSSLSDKDVTIPFEFAVFSPLNDSNPIPIRSAGFLEPHEAMDHLVSLFPNDVIEKPYQLMVYFPGQRSHILKSLSVLMFGSILFTMIILFSSGLSIFVIIRQKKISDIKTDFINNMTHEFKTPIATISIAADSINNPKVIDSPDQIKSYTRIIKEENIRMNTRVEQILQMSLLDSRDFKLHLEPLNLQELISRAVDHFKLIVEKRGGRIETRFEASNLLVLADEGHMRNVLMNLLDNANKYSISNPDITVTTGNRSGQFFFQVEDKGMGMSQDVQKRVFDKFFRVTTGNVHNIKGFGLGLSYVKAIVLTHQGEIQLTSEPGKGSRFIISLPVAGKDEERETKDVNYPPAP
ncbi:MAG: HAMP domain-containing histidine kinase [Bacteroidia bacterium]|nr:HAMP domain-containing histidine kinase [Bacteroidia bacterium]